MLFRSNDNLEQGAVSFIKNNEEVVLFSAYLKLDALKRLNVKNNIKHALI